MIFERRKRKVACTKRIRKCIPEQRQGEVFQSKGKEVRYSRTKRRRSVLQSKEEKVKYARAKRRR